MIISSSKRLTLRNWELSDAPAAFEFYGDPVVSKLVNDGQPLPDVARTEKVLAKFMDHQAMHGFCPWAVIDNETQKVIGICGLHTYNETAEMELGFRMNRRSWGKGLATEASQLSLDYAFGNFNPPHVSALTDVENFATQKVLAKLGFIQVGEAFESKFGRELLRFEFRKNGR